jgi:hypothetical protein
MCSKLENKKSSLKLKDSALCLGVDWLHNHNAKVREIPEAEHKERSRSHQQPHVHHDLYRHSIHHWDTFQVLAQCM